MRVDDQFEKVDSTGFSQVFRKHPSNPIISPRSGFWWESRQTFNPGAAYVEGRVHLLYRAIGEDWISRLGYASSVDALRIVERLSYPVYEHKGESAATPLVSPSGGSFLGAEDPRLVRVDGEDRLYMTYTAYDGLDLGVALTSINLESFLEKEWDWARPRIISPPGEPHKNWVLFPKKFEGKYAVLHSLSPTVQIEYLDSLEVPEGFHIRSVFDEGFSLWRGGWEMRVRGAAAPPIETGDGWLLLYHATDAREPEKYKVGAMLLDLHDPKRVLAVADAPVLEPTEAYEYEGFKPGVIYVTGAVAKGDDLLVYYGAADSYVCVARGSLSRLVELLLESGKGEAL
ncbi:MAG: hypothetical protein BA066_07205 [Candidatus Korarchaeota archaeon NZ13-K]|nr:MAG: hypothetical protein BA066_07205 [Candidatus Korarchaeota archaeon NZ13-K]